MTFLQNIKQNNYLFLLEQFSITDFKLRYTHSVLGYLWSLLKPLLMFGVLFFVFSVFIRFGKMEHYQIYLLSGILLWTYFSEATSSGMESLLSKASLLNKVNFPRIIIILSSSLTSAMTLLINLFVLSFFILVAGIKFSFTFIFIVPIVIELILLSFGISLMLASIYLRFRDLLHIWTVMLQLGFWATPIIYPINVVPDKYRILIYINPMARIIQSFREVVIYGERIDAMDMLITFAGITIFIILGYFLFTRNQKHFAEWI